MWMVAPIHCSKLHFKKRKKIMKMNFKQNNIKLAIAAGLVIGSASFTLPAFASSSEKGEMDVKANIAVACTIAIDDLDFGSYDALDTHKTTAAKGSGKITATCTSGASGKITINEGGNKITDGDFPSSLAAPKRQMMTDQDPASGQTKFLAYTLHEADSFGSAQWNGTTGVTYVSSGSDVAKTIYGFIPPAQNTAMKGSYADEVEIVVTY